MKQTCIWNICKQGLGMYMRFLTLFTLACMLMAASCTKDPIDPPVEPKPPGAFSLTTPANGAKLAGADVNFSWGSSQYASSYTLEVKEGSTVAHSQSYSGTSAQVSLQKGKSYSWKVTASNNEGTKSSSTYTFSIMEDPPEPVVTQIQSAPYFEIVYNYANQTIHPTEPSNFGDEGLSFTVELYKQICISCDRELVEIREVTSLAELQTPMAVERYRNYYIMVTASKQPPGEAQVSYTQSIFIFKDNRYNGEP